MTRRLRTAAGAACLVPALVSCAAFSGPSPSDPLCDPADGVNVYVDQGARATCQLRVGQRFVVQMPRSQGSDDALRTVCLTVWHGESFVINFGKLDYCVLHKRTA
jgi:hypothetical protein